MGAAPQGEKSTQRLSFGAAAWAFVAPAALTLMARIGDEIELSDRLADLVRNWRAITQRFWQALVDFVQFAIPLPDPNAQQMDILTLSATLAFSAISARVLSLFYDERPTAPSEVSARAMYQALALAVMFVVFLAAPMVKAIIELRSATHHVGWFEFAIVWLIAILIILGFTALADGVVRERGWQRLPSALTLYGLCAMAAFFSADRLQSVSHSGAALWVGGLLAATLAIIQVWSPKSVSKIVLLAGAVFLVDRAWILTEPLAAWLESVTEPPA